MTRLTRFFVCALAFGLAATAVPALAEQGNAVLRSKQREGRTVTLGNGTYRVSESTVLEDKDGKPTTFEALPTTAQGASQDDAAVWFETGDSEVQNSVLHLLKLTGRMPR